MKALNTTPRIAQDPLLQRELTEHATLVNALSEGRIAANVNARIAPPVGLYVQGDFVRNRHTQEMGEAGSKYVLFGWICTASGDPATFVEARLLTGN
jgi:hypothetical protein